MTTRLYQGDCLSVMKTLPGGVAHLIYLDPPFFTQKTHSLRTGDRQREFSFRDAWASELDYVTFLRERLIEMHRVLAKEGSIFFHCDRNSSHIARILLDEVFGADMFRSEIIWHYRRWSNAAAALLPAHQTIHYYSKTKDYLFNPIHDGYSPSTNVDQILQRRVRDEHGKSVYERNGSGEIVPNGGKRGVPLSDVWDIPYLNPKARERVGYPTQKPVLLLERIIKLASREGDLVLDPFCGSGTAIVAATLLGRRAIGMDIAPEAIDLTRGRLNRPVRTASNLMDKGRDSYANADNEILALLEGLSFVPVQRNRGIDAILKDDIDGHPLLVRIQRPNETVTEAADLLLRAARGKQAAMMFLVVTDKEGSLSAQPAIPAGMMLVEAPALVIKEIVSNMKARADRIDRPGPAPLWTAGRRE